MSTRQEERNAHLKLQIALLSEIARELAGKLEETQRELLQTKSGHMHNRVGYRAIEREARQHESRINKASSTRLPRRQPADMD